MFFKDICSWWGSRLFCLNASDNPNAWPIYRNAKHREPLKGGCPLQSFQCLAKTCQVLSELFYFSLFSISFPPFPPASPSLLTVLGWRLRSLEWAHSNFYPSSFTASHDPWANGIAPSLFISLCIQLSCILSNSANFYSVMCTYLKFPV